MKLQISIPILSALLIMPLAHSQNALPKNAACQDLNELVLFAPVNKGQMKMKTDSFIFYGPNSKGVEEILYEGHHGAFNANTPHPLWSASKALTTAAAARAIKLGLLNPEATLIDVLGKDYITGLRKWALRKYLSENPKKVYDQSKEAFFGQIRIRHIIEMTTGLDWFEHEDHGLSETSSMNMLYGPGAANQFEYVMGLPMKFAPGRAWNYSSGNTILLSAVLRKVAGPNFYQWLLFQPLGLSESFVEKDPSGLAVGSSFGYMSAYDMLALGKVFLNNGTLNGKQFFPETWMKQATQAHESYHNIETDAAYVEKEKMVYGWALAVNQGFPNRKITKPFPNAPKDMFFAAGHFGQLIIVIPSRRALIVRTGYDASYWAQVGNMTELSLKCFLGNSSKDK